MQKLELDLHTHTVMSGHAYSTLQEMAHAAAIKGLKTLGITDHAPAIEGAPSKIYFEATHVIPRYIEGVRILVGTELNILDSDGTIDLPDKILAKLDYATASLHSKCYKRSTVEQDTMAVINAIKNPYVKIICHPADGTCDLDFEAIIKAAKENRVLLEINNSSLNPDRGKPKSHDYNLQLLTLCKKHSCPVILGSDAHISFDVGNIDFIIPLLQETQFPDNLIMNYSMERVEEYLFRV